MALLTPVIVVEIRHLSCAAVTLNAWFVGEGVGYGMRDAMVGEVRGYKFLMVWDE